MANMSFNVFRKNKILTIISKFTVLWPQVQTILVAIMVNIHLTKSIFKLFGEIIEK